MKLSIDKCFKLGLKMIDGDGNEVQEIITPFANKDNDAITIYVQKIGDGKYKLTDFAETFDNLELAGADADNMLDIFKSALIPIRRLGCKFGGVEGEFYPEITTFVDETVPPTEDHFSKMNTALFSLSEALVIVNVAYDSLLISSLEIRSIRELLKRGGR